MKTKPENSRFTDEQWEAIHQKGTNLLVSASAGAGKTSVLIQRILAHLYDDQWSLSQLLVVTFTDLAAQEMKERLNNELKENLNQEADPQRRKISLRELGEVSGAQISTIDSFCREVVNRYYDVLGLDPNYQLITDSTQLALLREELWTELKERILNQEGKLKAYYDDYLLFSQNFADASENGEQYLDQMITENLYQKAMSHEKPLEWLSALVEEYPKEDPSIFFKIWVFPSIKEKILTLQKYMQEAINLAKQAENDFSEEKVFSSILDKVMLPQKEALDLFIENLSETLTYESLFESYQRLPFKTIGNIGGTGKSEEAKQLKKEVISPIWKEAIDLSKSLFPYYPEDEKDMSNRTYQVGRSFVRLEQLFIDRFEKKMIEEKRADFALIEQWAYDILTNEDFSEARIAYQDRFKEILIDEYQDVNGLQEAILREISDNENGHYRFMVGDLKQSIYRFRYANPDIFLEKYQTYTQEGNQEGKKINLLENFRSRSEILDFINLVFNQLMTKELGGIDYEQEAQLLFGNTSYPHQEQENYAPELLLVEANEENLRAIGENADKVEFEAVAIAKRIQQLKEENFQVFDRKIGRLRPFRYGDIAILSSTRKDYDTLERVFREVNLPFHRDKAENYFRRTEMQVMIQLLKFVDNPQQDIPLVTLLRSPILNVTDEQLAKIRLANPSGSYYEAINSYLHSEDREKELLDALLKLKAWEKEWRDYAREHSIASLIWKIYNDTHFLDIVASESYANQRLANLHSLYLRASEFEKTQLRGLYAYIRYIEAVLKNQKDLETPQLSIGEDEEISIMTVHGSKGLEFPIVFYYQLDKRLNATENKAPYFAEDKVLDQKPLLGVQVTNRLLGLQYNETPTFNLTKEKAKKENTAEEMRKFYVALTRAEQKLILVGEKLDWEDIKEEKKVLSSIDSLEEAWLLPILKNLPHTEETLNEKERFWHYKLKNSNNKTKEEKEPQLSIKIQELSAKEVHLERIKGDENRESSETKLIWPKSDDLYPYLEKTTTSSYQSVSELKRLEEEPTDYWLTYSKQERGVEGLRYTEEDFPQPQFIQEQKPFTAANRGSAMHELLQFISLEEKPTSEAFQDLYEKLVYYENIEENSLHLEDFKQLERFFDTPFGQKLLENKDRLKREQNFSMGILPLSLQKKGETAEENILVHGTIDGYFFDEENELWLFDYKTDHLGNLSLIKQKQVLFSRYQSQLYYYSEALFALYQRKVDHSILVSLDTLESFEQ